MLRPSAPHVLVVEDDPDQRTVLTEALEDAGYPAVATTNGKEALDYLRTAHPPPCVILLDLLMPVMNGWEFRVRQRQDPSLSAIPVVVLTAVRSQPPISPFGNHLDVLVKPVDLAELLETIRKYCPHRAPPQPGTV